MSRNLVIAFLVVMVLAVQGVAFAGEKGKMVALLADYDDIKERTMKIRSTRAEGYSNDEKAIFATLRDCQELIKEAQALTIRLMQVNGVQFKRSAEAALIPHFTLACNAIHGMLNAELDYMMFKRVESLGAAAKFDDAWQYIDIVIQKNRKP